MYQLKLKDVLEKYETNSTVIELVTPNGSLVFDNKNDIPEAILEYEIKAYSYFRYSAKRKGRRLLHVIQAVKSCKQKEI